MARSPYKYTRLKREKSYAPGKKAADKIGNAVFGKKAVIVRGFKRGKTEI